MIHTKPKFLDSEFFIFEAGAWSIDPAAPQELKDEFLRFQAAMKQSREEWDQAVKMDPDTNWEG